jgi:D-alanine-D-alanine ligase-like ATP-grasp enzyme
MCGAIATEREAMKCYGSMLCFRSCTGRAEKDGTVQGALELADVRLVGASVTGSAVAMDKAVAKRLM